MLFYDAGQQKVFDYYQELAALVPGLLGLLRINLDQSGNLWISSLSGVLRVKPKAALFDTYFTEQNANCPGHCSFRGFAEDGSGSIYASFYNNIFKISSPKDRQSHYAPLLKEYYNPFDLLYYKGNLMRNSGLTFDEKTGQRLQSYRNTPIITGD